MNRSVLHAVRKCLVIFLVEHMYVYTYWVVAQNVFLLLGSGGLKATNLIQSSRFRVEETERPQEAQQLVQVR